MEKPGSKYKHLVSEIRKTVDLLNRHHDISDIMLRRSLTEAWFSNTLSWLLDTKADHGLGIGFAREFIKLIAEKRSASDQFTNRYYHLKKGKAGEGRTVTGLRIGNSAVLREYYLSGEVNKRHSRKQRYCDIVFLDLDSKDSFMMVIENKLFTTNHPGQLQEYFSTIQGKYERVKTREFVYLTLMGEPPVPHLKEQDIKHWVNVSWIKDILEILEVMRNRETLHKDVSALMRLLKYIKDMESKTVDADKLHSMLLEIASDCLIEELNRLGEGKAGNWKSKKSNKYHYSLSHSSLPTRKLSLKLLPNYSVTIQGEVNHKAFFEKILVPFGAQPGQIFNLFDLAARDIYYAYFSKTERYLGKHRRLTKTLGSEKQAHFDELKVVYRYRYELQLLLAMASHRRFIGESPEEMVDHVNRMR